MNNIGKRLMPIYLIKFLEENYFDIIPENFGKRMVSRQFIAEIKALYDEFDGKPIDNYGRRMVPEYLIKAFSDIEYIEYTDDDVKYEKTVPTGALKYATIDMLGGMSYKTENLLYISDVAETTTNGITYKIENGVITINGTATDTTTILISLNNTISSGSYYTKFYGISNATSLFNYIYFRNDGTYVDYIPRDNGERAVTLISNVNQLDFNIVNGATFNNLVIKPMLVTGSTAPTEFKAYFSGIRDSAVTSVVAKKTYEIDEHIQAITGYGWGVNDTCYNYIDYENKKFIQKVGRVDLGSIDYTYNSTRAFFGATLTCKGAGGYEKANALSSLYEIEGANRIYSSAADYDMHIGLSDTNQLFISNQSYTDAETFKTAMSGVYLYYELATPVETDISDYIKDNFIEVEPTGSVTFTNEYEQPVPSEVTYLIKE